MRGGKREPDSFIIADSILIARCAILTITYTYGKFDTHLNFQFASLAGWLVADRNRLHSISRKALKEIINCLYMKSV